MRILYLGTDPSRYVHEGTLVHYPVIRTVPILGLDPQLLEQCKQCSHWLFTSPNGVRHWFDLAPIQIADKQVYAVGASTGAALAQRGVSSKFAPYATQEGVIELLDSVDLRGAFICWPRSALARPVLANYLARRGVRYLAIDLYKAVKQSPEPVPDLAPFDEIVFTSPSTVRAFLEIFGEIPQEKKITPIGPVTAEVLGSL